MYLISKNSTSITLLLTSIFALHGCATTPVTSSATNTQGQPQVVVTTDNNQWNGSFKDQLQKALTDKLAVLGQKVTISNFTKMTSEEKTVDGKDMVFMNFYTADGKMYRTGVERNQISDEQIQKMHSLKGATIIGPIAIQNRTNEYFFQGFDKMVF